MAIRKEVTILPAMHQVMEVKLGRASQMRPRTRRKFWVTHSQYGITMEVHQQRTRIGTNCHRQNKRQQRLLGTQRKNGT